MNRLPNFARQTLMLLFATLGGCGASLIGMPLAWLIGALVVSGAFAFCGVSFNFARIRPYGLVVLGLALGQSFTPTILADIVRNLPLIGFCALVTLCAGFPVARLFTGMAGTDPKTAFFCAVPGGVVLMAVQAQRSGASERHVVLAQTVRLVMVVMIYPVLIALLTPAHALTVATGGAVALPPGDGWKLAALVVVSTALAYVVRRTFIPNPWMIVPCFLAIGLAQFDLQPAHMPEGAVMVCQVILGASLGAQMTRGFILGSRKLLTASVLSALMLTVLLVPFALVVAYVSGLDVAAVLLGMAPGGMPEMTVAAKAMGVAVPLVLSFHLVRILIGNLLIEPVWWLAQRLGLKATDMPSERK
ncbi:MAG TPA: AbrB family transcriptional regulator [Paenirhodobacter sp.]